MCIAVACQDVQYRYVNTKENPADLATRGATVSELKADTLWFEGPQFLKTPTLWPPGLQPIDILNLAPEIEATTFTCSKLLTPEPITTDSSTIDVRKFSKWNILIHSVILFLQFIAILSFKCKIKIKTTKDFTTSGSTSKRQKAIRLLIKEAQKRQPPPIQSQKKYRMFLDKEELWRCKHRVSNNAEFELHPYYLPPNDHLTTLIILYNHEKLHHSGIPATVAKLEQQFTIPKTRQTVKKVLKKHCMVCRRYQAKPYRQPDMPPLPTERVTQEKPFFRTGLDYFGHLWIKTTGEPQKVWVLLLTCFCTRAVHLEMVPDMTTLAFLRAFSRFTARKGQPHFLLSDNATQFHLASTLINGNVNSLQQKLTDKNITWTFIPALSPWQGGIYERMVGIVKTNLRKAIGRNMLTYDELNTVLCESENIVNSRPLTHVDSDGDNFTLKPCNFLFPLESYSTAETINTSDDDEWHPTKSTTTLLEILTRPVNALYSLELGVCKAELTTPPPDREKPASPTTTSATSDSQQPISDGPAARTRSRLQKARTNLSLLTMICLLLCQISNVHGDVGRCKEINGKVLQIIPSCIEAGIRILQVTGDKKCWIPIVCRGGKNPKHPASCSSRCSCPSWATDCSFYNGTETAISKIDYPPLKEALKKHTFEICSTNRTDKCSSNQQKIVAHKIQLFDGNEVIVKTFHLTTADVSKEDKPKCIGQGTITGTSKYCALNQCAPSGTQFCYFDQSPITYLVLDKLHIPIKAWGHHEIIFYGPK
uniref:Integrase catalytic domain-containing protein n=1 Tax=Panagrolaimus superbus TaxID=310955 RepID=A0A914Z4E9_9BILA